MRSACLKPIVPFLAGLLILLAGVAQATDLEDKGDWTILDRSTGLMWQKLEGGKRNWEEAIVFCENLTLAGYKDWRLPDINELMSLVDRTRYNPVVDRHFFPDVAPSVYWTSSTPPSHNDYAWFVSFHTGKANNYDKRYSYYVRCVRGNY